MPKVRQIGSTGQSGVLEVSDTSPYISSGKYELYNEAPLPTTPTLPTTTIQQPSPAINTQAQVQPTNLSDRPLTPDEYKQLTEQFQASPANFNQYFSKKGQDIFVLPDVIGTKIKNVTEFQELSKQFGATPKNFSNFFTRVGKDIYLKPQGKNTKIDTPFIDTTQPMDVNNIIEGQVMNLSGTALFSNDTKDADDLVSSFKALMDATKSDAQKRIEENISGLTEKLTADMEKAGKKGSETNRLNNDYNIAYYTGKVAELDGQIEQKIAEYEKAQVDAEGQPIPVEFITGQQAQLKKLAAADIAILTAKRSMYSGQLDAAKDAVAQAIELEFGGLQDQIKNTFDLISLNKENLTAEQKKQSQIVEFVLGERTRQLEEAKTDKQNLYDLMLAVIKNGGDVSKFDFKKSYEENLKLVSTSIQESDYQVTQIGEDKYGGKIYGVLDKNTGKISQIQAGQDGVTYGNTSGLNRPTRNNNPLNVKFGSLTRKWVDNGVASLEQQSAMDGGNFLIFKDAAAGFNAAEDLLFYSGLYSNMTVEKAMRTWSGNGYGAEVSPGINGNKLIKDLGGLEKGQLIEDMARREGFSFQSTTQQGTPMQDYESIFNNIATKYTSRDKRITAQRTFDELMANGNQEGAIDFLEQQAYGNLTAAQKGDYDQFANAIVASEQALSTVGNTTSGFYKALAQEKSPYLAIQKDPEYANLRQWLNLADAQIRRGFFGTAVTQSEAGTATGFLFDQTDDINIIAQKLRGNIAFFNFVNDAEIARQLGLPHPKLQDYLDKYGAAGGTGVNVGGGQATQQDMDYVKSLGY